MTKRLIFATLTIAFLAIFTGCDNKETNPLNPDTGKLFVTSTPTNADVYVNGTNRGKTGDSLTLNAGTYSVTLKKTLYKDTTFSVTIVANQTITRNITLSAASFTISSTPAGAKIYLNGVNTGSVTPAGITLALGTNTITLSLSGYNDTTFTIPADSANISRSITLVKIPLVEYTSVRIYESNSTAAVPSGLILSTGRASLIGSGVSKDSVDIYYKTNGFLVASAKDNIFNLPRETFFKIGGGTTITDGEDSPAKDATWTLSVGDRETNYFFLYTTDQHYAKMKITGFGGGTGVSDPTYIELRWYFNQTKNDRKF
jgi:hypothetical protein